VDPSIKIVVCGSGGFGMDWNREVIKGTAELMDYLSIHHYENPDNFKDGPRAYEAFFRQTNLLIEKSANPNLRIYVSEWNAQSTDWRTGLYCGGLLNAFERCGEFLEIGGPALFLRHLSATAWDNAFINFDHAGWFPAPNYVVMKLWRDNFGTKLLGMEGDAGVLNAVATKSADGKSLFFKVVNPSDERVGVVLTILPDFYIREAKFQLIAPGDLRTRNTLASPHRIKPEPGRIAVDGHQVRFELPGVSAGVVTTK
jgi:alpha-N-arabinofuranosidase